MCEVAIRGARDLMCAEIAQGYLCLGCRIEVRDGDGEIVLELPLQGGHQSQRLVRTEYREGGVPRELC